MIKLNTKRRKIITLFFSLSFFTTVIAGCTPPQVVTIRMILNGIIVVKNLLDTTQKLSKTTANTVNIAYQDLGKDLRNKDFSTDTIAKMEDRHSKLLASSNQLSVSIKQTK